MGDALFGQTQQRVLALLFGQPERSFYFNELVALSGSGSGAVQRELAPLVQSGLVVARDVGRQKHYEANRHSPIFADLCSIVNKTIGLAKPLREALALLATSLRAAFIYGSVAKRQDTAGSDIDLMLVGDDVTYAEVFSALEEATQRLGREVKPTIYTPGEWAARVAKGDGFVKRVLAQPRIWLIGSDDALDSA